MGHATDYATECARCGTSTRVPENRTSSTACSRARHTTRRGTRNHIVIGGVYTVGSSFRLYYTLIDVPFGDFTPDTAKMLVGRQHRPVTRTRADHEHDRNKCHTV